MCPAEILAPDVAAQPILNVVGLGNGIGFILERDQACDGSEDFVLGNFHAVVDISKHRGPYESAGPQRLRPIRGIRGPITSATNQRGALLGPAIDVTAYLLQVGLA